MHNIDFNTASSETIVSVLSDRIEAIRLNQNMTQAELAKKAGISRSTVTRFVQDGKGISLDSFIRILQALHLEDNLRVLLPDPGINPLQQLEQRGKQRQRARPGKTSPQPWHWGDDRDTQ